MCIRDSPCTELPAFIIRRLTVRFTYDNNYFNALYQGIPNGGYTAMVERMLEGTEVRLGVDYLEVDERFIKMSHDYELEQSNLKSMADVLRKDLKQQEQQLSLIHIFV